MLTFLAVAQTQLRLQLRPNPLSDLKLKLYTTKSAVKAKGPEIPECLSDAWKMNIREELACNQTVWLIPLQAMSV